MEENNKKVTQTPKKSKEKKKLSTFVTFPLVLGATCLLCGGAVSGIYYVTKSSIDQNIAKANAQGLYTMLGEQAVDVMTPVSIRQTAILKNAIDFTVKQDSKFSELNSGNPRYYVLTTPKGFKGRMNIGAIVYSTNSKAVVYDMVVTANIDEDGKGYGDWSNPSYEFPGYDGSNFQGITGSSVTSGTVKSALDAALDHYQNGDSTPDVDPNAKPKDGTYEVTGGSAYGKFTGKVTIKDNKVIKIEITEKDKDLFPGILEGKFGGEKGKAYYDKYIDTSKGGISCETYINYSKDDNITGATIFSDGFIDFIMAAINKAKQ